VRHLAISDRPRVRLSHSPTPLEPLTRLSRHLGGPHLYIKRDDCSGLATGGNKARKLEFLLGEALADKATDIITVGALQSNHVRQTAAAAARLGIPCIALLEEKVPIDADAYRSNGNVLLDQLLGAEVRRYPRGTDMAGQLELACAALRAQGRRPYAVAMGGSSPVGSLGYMDCAEELVQQADEMNIPLSHIVVATGSGGTHAGLLAGMVALQRPVTVCGINIMGAVAAQRDMVGRLAERTLALAGVAAQGMPADIQLYGDYLGTGYGMPTAAGMAAIRLLAEQEGVLLDPVYTGKAMSGLLDLLRQGHWSADDHVVFLHTGGQAGLFAYADSFPG